MHIHARIDPMTLLELFLQASAAGSAPLGASFAAFFTVRYMLMAQGAVHTY